MNNINKKINNDLVYIKKSDIDGLGVFAKKDIVKGTKISEGIDDVINKSFNSKLDARKAELELDWHNKLTFKESLEWTVNWQKSVNDHGDAREVSLSQVSNFRSLV